MELEIKPIACFVTLATELNFGRAAKRMHMAQPSLSAQIRKLEKRLDMQLFHRSTRSVTLSRQGEYLLPHARKLLAEADRFDDHILNAQEGIVFPLIFGTPIYTFDFPEHDQILSIIADELPSIDLKVLNAHQGDLIQLMENGKVDIALMIGRAIPRFIYESERKRGEHSEILFPDDLPRLRIRTEPIKLAIPIEHPLASCEKITSSKLANTRIATLSHVHGRLICDPIQAVFEEAKAELFSPPEAHGIALERYCRQHRIPAISVGWFRQDYGSCEDLVYRSIPGLDLSTELALIRARSSEMSISAQKTWDLIEQKLAIPDSN